MMAKVISIIAFLGKGLLPLPVHEFYSPLCCSGTDCRPVSCEEVVSIGNGWVWKGWTFKRSALQIAPDGNCHVCIHKMSGIGDAARCIYLPAEM